jgi:hypothetical protein
MTRRDISDQVIALQTRPSSTHEDEPESGANEHNADLVEYTEQISSRRADSRKKRACVLLGSAIIQFPIWGKSLSLVDMPNSICLIPEYLRLCHELRYLSRVLHKALDLARKF